MKIMGLRDFWNNRIVMFVIKLIAKRKFLLVFIRKMQKLESGISEVNFMTKTTQSKIKVVKKADIRHRVKKAKRGAEVQARTIVNNVSGWINEVKERKSAETRAAIDLLLNSRERVTGS